MAPLIWFGICFCISQSAMFSGLNLAFFSLSRLRLEVEASKGSKHAERVLSLREDSNFLLTTILWGNVGINVLLTLLSNSVMAGVFAFLFSTMVITFLGEIIPQAYFSRHALRMASLLAPVLRLYQILLYPVAKSTALFLDKWLGKEAIQYFKERDLRELISLHVDAQETEIDSLEGRGALNFLATDDIPILAEGESIDPLSIIPLRFEGKKPLFPSIEPTCSDKWLESIHRARKKWVIIVDQEGEPRMAMNADSLLREALFEKARPNLYKHCHRPIIIRDPREKLGEAIPRLKVHPLRADDDVIDEDIILYWGEVKRIITGSDILGRLLRGIVQNVRISFEAGEH